MAHLLIGGVRQPQSSLPDSINDPDDPAIVPEAGLMLMDLSLNVIAIDRGAAGILTCLNGQGVKSDTDAGVPKEILDIVRNRKSITLSSSKTQFRVGRHEYSCRTHLVDFHTKVLSQPLMALHLEKVSSVGDQVHEARVRYNLTEREEETLRGISMGLTAKEVADLMNISPNTVKAFLRLIMIKMTVTTRAGIIAKLLQNGPGGSTERLPMQRSEVAAAGTAAQASANTAQAKLRPR
jgi:DNA-binding CsgD family transcriptional regulator